MCVLIWLAAGPSAAAEDRNVPPYGSVQFGYGSLSDREIAEFLQRCHVNVLESSEFSPISSAWGWDSREKFNASMARARGQVRLARQLGVTSIYALSYHAFIGDAAERTGLFALYDRYWSQYTDYLGPRPPDPIEWTARDDRGQPWPFTYEGSPGYRICPNNPHWLAYLNGVLRIVADSGVDGVRYDGPSTSCGRCVFCRDAFRKWLAETYTQRELADVFALDSASNVEIPLHKAGPLKFAWDRFRLFRYGQTVAETRAAVRTMRPNFIMSYNYYIGGAHVLGSSEFEYLAAAGDYALVESGSNASAHAENGRKFSISPECKYLLAAGCDKPINRHYYLYAVDEAPPKQMAAWPPEKVASSALFWKAALAEGMAVGCPLTIRAIRVHPQARDAVIQYADFFHRCQPYLTNARTCANVAVLASISQTLAAVPSYPLAVSRYLADQHIPHVMIIERDLTAARLAEFDALILPGAIVLSDAQAAVISEYVTAGKGLIVFGPAGLRDEYSRPRSASCLGTLLGIQGRDFPDAPFRRQAGQGRIAWFPMPPLPESARAPLPEPAAQALKDLPDALVWACARGFSAYLNAPDMVELTLMRSPDRRLLLAHLMNYHLEVPAKLTPYANLKLGLALPEGRSARRVLLLSPDLPQEQTVLTGSTHDWRGCQYLSLTVPRIEIYDLVVVELD